MTNEFKITKTGKDNPYKTRNGNKAVALCIDAPSDRPVIGYVTSKENSFAEEYSWHLSGVRQLNFENGLDIISEWREPDVKEWWTAISHNGEIMPDELPTKGDVMEEYNNLNTYLKFRLTIQPDGKQHLEILEQVNREDV